MKNHACLIELAGVVQGVGFRPFVHRLAQEFHLGGFVANTSSGVRIVVEGSRTDLAGFYAGLQQRLPPLARIIKKEYRSIEPCGYKEFRIRNSVRNDDRSALVSPDIGLCEDCRKELFSPEDRRYLYPFINCTNCGPRFSIIKQIPYDRKFTTMSGFRMCPSCRREYETITDRRYHAQPNACSSCGPAVSLCDSAGRILERNNAAVRKTVKLLSRGSIAAVKGIGGFHIACNAEDPEAVLRLRKRKCRPAKPFAVMIEDISQIRRWCTASRLEEEILSSPERPIVLLEKKKDTAITRILAPDNDYIGVMLAYAPLHYLLLGDRAAGGEKLRCLVMTSANLADEPLIKDNAQALRDLKGICDYFLVHNRDIRNRCDDSIVQVMDNKAVILRRGRGYAPFPFLLGNPAHETVGCGAELKNTLCLAKNDRAFVSQYIGDLKTFGTTEFYSETLRLLSGLFSVKPRIVACDLHPDYFSTKFGRLLAQKSEKNKLVPVQHHQAHLASVVAEHRIEQPVIGICFDGIGLGSDGKIWGGEFFTGKLKRLRRAAHLDYIRMPGADKATQEPYRMAVSYLERAFGEDTVGLVIPFIRKYRKKIPAVLAAADIKPVWTSSCGRLFDAVSALLGICDIITYEAQAAIRLQMFAQHSQDEKSYPFGLRRLRRDEWIVDCRPLFKAIVSDIKKGTRTHDIARRFHNGLADVSTKICCGLRRSSRIDTVCLSGGVFQNKLFLEILLEKLRSRRFRVFYNELLPTNDGAISLGQVAIANEVSGKTNKG